MLIRYFIYCGLVFQPLSLDYADAVGLVGLWINGCHVVWPQALAMVSGTGHVPLMFGRCAMTVQ